MNGAKINGQKYDDEQDTYIVSRCLPTRHLLLTKRKYSTYSEGSWQPRNLAKLPSWEHQSGIGELTRDALSTHMTSAVCLPRVHEYYLK